MSVEDLLSLDNIQDGLPHKRANSILYLIENRTAQSVSESQHAAQYVPYPVKADERGMAYLDAFTLPAEQVRPSIQDIERYSHDWAWLVPPNPRIQAAIAHLMGERYRIDYQYAYWIRTALGLDTEPVKAAYQQLYGKSLQEIYVTREPLSARLAWVWAAFNSKLENLPPFWVTFALTLPVGPGLFALPIALAGIGPLPGVVLLVIFGLINMLTMAAVAEALARHGGVRYGNAFLGRVVADYLGRESSILLTVVMFLDCFLVLMVFYMGVSSTLQNATGISALVWTAGLFLIGLFFLSRGSLNATIASTLIIGAVNIGLIILLSAVAIPYLKGEYLSYSNVPFINAPFESSIIRLIFGVLLAAFFGQLLVGNYAKVALRRDPSARSFIHGSMASIIVTTVLSVIWLLAINGGIAPQTMAAEQGTALVPLARVVGPSVNVLGSIFATLSLGIASIHVSFFLFFTTLELLPKAQGQAKSGVLQSKQGRFWASAAPVIAAFVLTLWMLFTGSGSFTNLLSFLGVIAISLFAGIFPMLLLLSSRRKSDLIPQVSYRLLGNPIFVIVIYVLFLASIFLHGLIIWDNPLERIGALVVGVAVLVLTVVMFRRGAFAPRTVIELREEGNSKQARVSVIQGGKPLPSSLRVNDGNGEQVIQTNSDHLLALDKLPTISYQLPANGSKELKVWAHRVSPTGDSSPIPAVLEVRRGSQTETFDLAKVGGAVVVLVNGASCELTLTVKESELAPSIA